MMTNIRLTKKTGRWFLILAVAAVIAMIGLTRSSYFAPSYPNDVVGNKVAQGIQENVSKLACAMLVWHSEQKCFGVWSNNPEIAGTHQLWWNNNKIAISSKTSTTISDSNGLVSTSQEMTCLTYDGKTFRVAEMPTGSTGIAELLISKKPTYHYYASNYLEAVGWGGNGGLNHVSKPTEPGIEHWLIEDNNTIERTFHNTRTGQVGVQTYDVEKAYGLVTALNYYKEDVLQGKTTLQYMQLSDGSWFPCSVIEEGYNTQTGEVITRHKMDLDIDKSAFNDPCATPEDAFELKLGSNTNVTDLTSLKTKIKRFMKSL